MPFIIARVNVPVSREQEQEIKSYLGRAIELVPGKSEQYLLLGIEENYHFWLRGDDSQPAAYIEASIFGNESHCGYESFTREITKVFHEVLSIPPENIYLKYDDIRVWGVGGFIIERS